MGYTDLVAVDDGQALINTLKVVIKGFCQLRRYLVQ